MALIEKFHIVAESIPVMAGVELIEGTFVKLNSDGEVIKATGSASEVCLGVCGDTKSTSTSGLPSTNASSMGSFVNRVSDTFDETKASGEMTVYHSGGSFASNMFESLSYVPGEALYVSSNGKLTNVASSSGQVVAVCTKAPGAYDSGVPGLDTSNGSMQLSGSYIEFKLLV